MLNFVKYNKIDILLLQEHNIRKENVICKEILDEYNFEINYAISLKGGTAIMITKRMPIEIINIEKSANSRIISLELNYMIFFFGGKYICSCWGCWRKGFIIFK